MSDSAADRLADQPQYSDGRDPDGELDPDDLDGADEDGSDLDATALEIPRGPGANRPEAGGDG